MTDKSDQPIKDSKRKEQEEPQSVKDVQPLASVKSTPPWPLILVGVGITIVIASVFMFGWHMLVNRSQVRQSERMGSYGLHSEQGGRMGQRGESNFRGGGGMAQPSAARGVVTAISGDTVTVSGAGKQVSVKRSSSTTISGDKIAIAVNDTVIVYGTTGSDGVVSASRIVIRNQDAMNTDRMNVQGVAPGA